MAADALPDFVVRKMCKEDIPQVLEIWKDTGMHEGTYSVHTWFQVDPEAFYVAAIESGEVLGMCSAVVHPNNAAFLGLYAVRKKYRGKGIGPQIWNAAMEHVGDKNAAVNAVPGRLETYRDKAGFPLVAEWHSVVFERTQFSVSQLLQQIPSVRIRNIEDDLVEDVIAYDATVHGFRRSQIVSLTVREGDSVAKAAVTEDGRVCGYGCLKTSIQGHGQVGPLYCDNVDIAEVILYQLIQDLPQIKGLCFMTVSCNQGGIDIANKLDLEVEEDGPRCYRKEEITVDFSKVFGHHDLNFSPF